LYYLMKVSLLNVYNSVTTYFILISETGLPVVILIYSCLIIVEVIQCQ
jgi:hypothetical protein